MPLVPNVNARESIGCTVPDADAVTVTVPLRTENVVVLAATDFPPPVIADAATAAPATTTAATAATIAIWRRESLRLMVWQCAGRGSPLARSHLGGSLKNTSPR